MFCELELSDETKIVKPKLLEISCRKEFYCEREP